MNSEEQKKIWQQEKQQQQQDNRLKEKKIIKREKKLSMGKNTKKAPSQLPDPAKTADNDSYLRKLLGI